MPLRYTLFIPACSMRALFCMLFVWTIVPISVRDADTDRLALD
jgi:hypothetical protein